MPQMEARALCQSINWQYVIEWEKEKVSEVTYPISDKAMFCLLWLKRFSRC